MASIWFCVQERGFPREELEVEALTSLTYVPCEGSARDSQPHSCHTFLFMLPVARDCLLHSEQRFQSCTQHHHSVIKHAHAHAHAHARTRTHAHAHTHTHTHTHHYTAALSTQSRTLHALITLPCCGHLFGLEAENRVK